MLLTILRGCCPRILILLIAFEYASTYSCDFSSTSTIFVDGLQNGYWNSHRRHVVHPSELISAEDKSFYGDVFIEWENISIKADYNILLCQDENNIFWRETVIRDINLVLPPDKVRSITKQDIQEMCQNKLFFMYGEFVDTFDIIYDKIQQFPVGCQTDRYPFLTLNIFYSILKEGPKELFFDARTKHDILFDNQLLLDFFRKETAAQTINAFAPFSLHRLLETTYEIEFWGKSWLLFNK